MSNEKNYIYICLVRKNLYIADAPGLVMAPYCHSKQKSVGVPLTKTQPQTQTKHPHQNHVCLSCSTGLYEMAPCFDKVCLFPSTAFQKIN